MKIKLSLDVSIIDKENLYEFPTLYKIADSGTMRQWSIYIRLIKEHLQKILSL